MNDLIYGCAEDALSLWALQQKIDVITGSNNKSRTERIIFYRPSFGRGPSKATFGEFDSIIIEKNRIFLIESKWVERPTKTTEVRLAKHQIDRHKILSWYIKHWQGENDWDTFYDKWANIFPNEIETGHKVPSSKTKLSKKLKFLLDKT